MDFEILVFDFRSQLAFANENSLVHRPKLGFHLVSCNMQLPIIEEAYEVFV